MSTNKKRRVLFHRGASIFNWGTSGGQLKVRDAYEHFKRSEKFEPRVYFNEETKWHDNPGNVWLPYKDDCEKEWKIREDDVLFFSGVDWKVLPMEHRLNPPVPILNIAQPRHTDPSDKRYDYLNHRAIRIAKSSIGKKILEDFGANGPVYLIPDSIDMSLLPEPNPNPDIDVLIVGLKQPELAKSLQKKLMAQNWWRIRKINVQIQIPPKLPTRQDFIDLLNRSRIACFLPLEAERGAEGFYLPALEGMALEKLVVCPYAVGNIDFCIPDKTCIQPEFKERPIMRAINRALRMTEGRKKKMIAEGKAITLNHTIEQERNSLIELLHNADDIWNQKDLFQD